MTSSERPVSASAADIEVYLFAQPSGSNPEPKISHETLSAFSTLLKSTHTFIPRSSEESILSPRVARLVYRPPRTQQSDLREFRQSPPLVQFEKDHAVELVILPSRPRPRPIKLAVFDMDSTLINQEVIDELARTIGKADQVSEITERAMRGELDFAESLKARVKLLEGVRADIWESLRDQITFAEGARDLCKALKSNGVKMAVLSGGFQPMAEWVKSELGLDVAVANHLESSGPNSEYKFSHLIGTLSPDHEIVTAERKRKLTISLAEEYGLPLSEVLCVGDGANDLLMLKAVGEAGGVAVACRAKAKVQREAPNRLNGKSLYDILYLLGLQK